MKDEEDVIPTEPTTPAENEIKVTVATEEPTTSFFDTKPEEVIGPAEPKEIQTPAEITPTTPTEPVEPTEPIAPIEPVEPKEEKLAINSDAVISFLEKEHGIKVNSIEDLKPKEVVKLSPMMEKFTEYVKETNNENYEDFLATQKDWSQESQESVLKATMKLENPFLNKEEIDFLYNEKYGLKELDEFSEEGEVNANKSKEINAKVDFQKGLKLLEEQKEKYKAVKGFDEAIPQEFKEAKTLVEELQKQQEEDDKLIAENRNDYLAKTESIFAKDFKGFEVKVGEEVLYVKPENLDESKKLQSDLSNFNNKYFDKNGKLIDAEGFHKALYFGMNADKMAQHFISIGEAKRAEADDKIAKNITTETKKPAPIGDGNIKVTVVQ